MFDEADSFPTRIEYPRHPMIGEPTGSIYFAQGPRRVIEPDFIKKEKSINRHQETVKHHNICRCNQYKNNDLVVMHEHIGQYPQFRCYCKYCLLKLRMDCDIVDHPGLTQDRINRSMQAILRFQLFTKEGIKL